MRPLLCSHDCVGLWEARTMSTHEPASTQVADRGEMWPLLLRTALDSALHHTRRVPWNLQALVIQWRNQAAQHAAVLNPTILPVQLNRFGPDGQKDQHPIILNPVVYVPRFVDNALATTSDKYSLASVVFHIGPSKHSGHYRAALFGANGFMTHLTEDGVSAIPSQRDDLQVVRQNACVCFLVKSI